MSLKAGLKIGIAAASLLFIAGLAYWGKRQYSLLLDFCYKIYKFQILEFSKNRIAAKFFLKFKNQSDITLNIKSFDVTVYLMGIKLAVVKNASPQKIAKNGVSELSFTLSVDPQNTKIKPEDLLSWVMWFILGQTEKIKLRFVIQAYAGTLGIIYPIKELVIDYTLKDLLSDNTSPTTCKID